MDPAHRLHRSCPICDLTFVMEIPPADSTQDMDQIMFMASMPDELKRIAAEME